MSAIVILWLMLVPSIVISKTALPLGSDMSPFAMRRQRVEGETTGLLESEILSKSSGHNTDTELPVSSNASVLMSKTLIDTYRPFEVSTFFSHVGLGRFKGVCTTAGV